MAVTTSAGFQGKVQIDKGQTGSFTEVQGITSAPPEFSVEELDTTEYGDEGMRRLEGLEDGTVDIEVNFDDGDSGQSDLLDAVQDGALVDVELSPNSRDSSATTIVFAWTCRVFSVSFDTSVDGKVTATFSLSNADGNTFGTSSSFT